MSVPTMLREIRRLRQELAMQKAAPTPLVEKIRQDPAQAMIQAGMTPDPWQAKLLRKNWTRALLLCSRQSGKSQVAGALALGEALTRPRSLILLLAQNQRASSELFRDKLLPLWRAMGRPLQDRPPTQLSLELANGSRLVALPTNEGGIRSYSGVRLLVCDEAARIPDDFFRAVSPMLAVSRGRMICMSSPFGKRGFFYEEWSSQHEWERVRITAHECPRISKQFLGAERETIGDRWFRQEYECFPGDTDVISLSGVKSIRDVRVGDLVLGHSNRYRKVLHTMDRPYTGTMVHITTYGHSRPIICTPEHPIGVYVGGQCYGWRAAQELKPGDELTFNRPPPRKMQPLSEDWVRLLGWYIAEGSSQKNAVTFSLGYTEQEYVEEILSLLERTIALKATVRRGGTNDSCLIVQANSVDLKEMLIRWCGRGQAQRQIPFQLIGGHEQVLLDTLLKGDGCEWRGDNSPKDTYITISKTLTYQVQMLFHQLGRQASIHIRHRPEGSVQLFPSGRTCAVQTSYAVVSYIRKPTAGNKVRLRCRKYRVTTPVRRVEFIEGWSGMVYNMEVDHDNSYTANGRIVHNCSFEDMVGAVFRQEDIDAAFANDLEPLFVGA